MTLIQRGKQWKVKDEDKLLPGIAFKHVYTWANDGKLFYNFVKQVHPALVNPLASLTKKSEKILSIHHADELDLWASDWDFLEESRDNLSTASAVNAWLLHWVIGLTQSIAGIMMIGVAITLLWVAFGILLASHIHGIFAAAAPIVFLGVVIAGIVFLYRRQDLRLPLAIVTTHRTILVEFKKGKGSLTMPHWKPYRAVGIKIREALEQNTVATELTLRSLLATKKDPAIALVENTVASAKPGQKVGWELLIEFGHQGFWARVGQNLKSRLPRVVVGLAMGCAVVWFALSAPEARNEANLVGLFIVGLVGPFLFLPIFVMTPFSRISLAICFGVLIVLASSTAFGIIGIFLGVLLAIPATWLLLYCSVWVQMKVKNRIGPDSSFSGW